MVHPSRVASMAILAAPLLVGCVIGAPAQGLSYEDRVNAPSLPTAAADVSGPQTGSSSSELVDACQAIPADASRADQVCATWRCARRDVSPLVWTGNANICKPGDIDSV